MLLSLLRGLFIMFLIPMSIGKAEDFSLKNLNGEIDLGPWLQTSPSGASFGFWKYPNFGLFTNQMSFAFSINNDANSPEKMILNVDYASLDKVTLFVKTPSGEQKIGDRGFLFPTKDAYGSLTPSFELLLPPGIHAYRLEVETDMQMIVPIRLLRPELHQTQMRQRWSNLTFIYGALLAMMAFNTLLAIGLRDNLYLIYVGWMGSFVFANASWDGIVPQLLSSLPWTWLWNKGSYICLHSGYLLGTIFIIRFLRLKYNKSFFYKIAPATLGIYAFALLSTLIDTRPGLWLFSFVYSATGALFVSAAVIWAFRGSRAASVLATGWTPVILGQGIQIGTNLGIVPVSEFIARIPHQVVIFESIIISLALALRFVEREKKQQQDITGLNQELQKRNEIVQDLNRTLEIKVKEKTRNIKSIFEFIELGIFTIDMPDGKVADEYSRFLATILDGQKIAGQDPIHILFENSDTDHDTIERTRSAIQFIIGENLLNFELNRDNLVNEIRLQRKDQQRIIQVDWSAILEDDRVIKVLVVLKDITDLRVLEHQSRMKQKELDYIAQMLNAKPQNFARFLRSSNELATRIEDNLAHLASPKPQDIQAIFLDAHTLKGTARSLGLTRLSNLIHQFESYMHDVRDYRTVWDLQSAHQLYQACAQEIAYYRFLFTDRLGRSEQINESLEVDIKLLTAVHDELLHLQSLQKETASSSTMQLSRLLYRPLPEFLEDCCSIAQSIALDLHKLAPAIDIQAPTLHVPRACEDILYPCFLHIIRNAMDHGIEADAERVERGKPPQGLIQIKVTPHSDSRQVQFSCFDDGRGINLKVIEEKALQLGLMSASEHLDDHQVAQFIFKEGFSTAQVVSQISGRGVGMNAIKSYIEEKAKGRIWLDLMGTRDSRGYCPFTLQLSLNADLFVNSHENLALKDKVFLHAG